MKSWENVSLLLLRLAIGFYFLLAGWGKVYAEFNEGFGHFYNTSFKALSPAWLPGFMGMPYGYALPWLEVLTGALLIVGLYTRWVATAMLLMLVSFTLALIIFHNNITAQASGPGGPFHANYIMIAAVVALMVFGAGRVSVDSNFLNKK